MHDEGMGGPGGSLVDVTSVDTVEHAAQAALASIRWALGSSQVSVRLSMPDSAGRLRLVWAIGGETSPTGRTWFARRREVFLSGVASRHDLEADGAAIGMLPVPSDAGSLGVLEVVAHRHALGRAWAALPAIAGQLALAISQGRREEALRRDLGILREAVTVCRTLAGVPSPEEALRLAAGFVSRAFEAPVAVWLAETGSSELSLLDMRRISTRRRAELQLAMRSLPRPAEWSGRRRRLVVTTYCRIVGRHAAEIVDVGDALMLIGYERAAGASSPGLVAELLADALGRRAVRSSQADHERRDLALAWAAHELRSPLLGVRAALEAMSADDPWTDRDRVLLGSSLRELDQMAGLIDDLLGWAAWGETLKRREVDLVALVADVAGNGADGSRSERVVLEAPDSAMADVDPAHLKTAIANVVRNAHAYSSPGSGVEVKVEATETWIQVAVHNRGSTIPSIEGESVFEPLVRRDVEGRNPAGKGLGLYIARRVIDAHGGRIWFESDDDGTTFYIRLPQARHHGGEATEAALAWLES